MTQINAYLNFNGNCREAMQFYKDSFGGELFLQPIKDTPMEAQCAAGKENDMMHVSLTGDSFVLMVSDMIGPQGYQPGTNFSLSINCSSEEQLTTLFGKLSKDGQVFMPVSQLFWGSLFGALSDRFGTRWMLNYDKPKA